eukprot:2256692-Pyramimonas_sp.AAC.1
MPGRHWTYQALAVLKIRETVDNRTGVQKNRLQVKKIEFCGEARPTFFLRPSNGRSSPGVRCPESVHSRVTALAEAGAPRYFIHGTK